MPISHTTEPLALELEPGTFEGNDDVDAAVAAAADDDDDDEDDDADNVSAAADDDDDDDDEDDDDDKGLVPSYVTGDDRLCR